MLIRSKLILWFTVLVASVMIVFSYSIYYFYSLYRTQEFYNRLEDKAVISAKLFLEGDHVNASIVKYIHRGDLNSLNREKVSIYDYNGDLIYSSNDEEDALPITAAVLDTIRTKKAVEFAAGTKEVVGIVYQDRTNRFIVIASAYDGYGLEQLYNIKMILLIANVIGIVVVCIMGWFYAGKVLSPISEVIWQVSHISPANLSSRVDEGNRKDEIAQLAITFNRMLDRVQNAFEVRKSFVSHASHELRTPLANIYGTLETSYYYDQELEDSKKSVYSSMEEINKLVRLVNGLLSLAKMEDGNAVQLTTLVAVDEVILQSITDLKKKYPTQKIGFGFGRLSDDYNDFKIIGNEELIKTTFLNIIENACKFSNGEKIEITIEISSSQELTVIVQDHGLGIAPNDLKFIFEPLYRGTNVRHIAGFGIGLALVQRIVKLHRGEIYLESEPGKGTAVVIVLPLAITGMFNF